MTWMRALHFNLALNTHTGTNTEKDTNRHTQKDAHTHTHKQKGHTLIPGWFVSWLPLNAASSPDPVSGRLWSPGCLHLWSELKKDEELPTSSGWAWEG